MRLMFQHHLALLTKKAVDGKIIMTQIDYDNYHRILGTPFIVRWERNHDVKVIGPKKVKKVIEDTVD